MQFPSHYNMFLLSHRKILHWGGLKLSHPLYLVHTFTVSYKLLDSGTRIAFMCMDKVLMEQLINLQRLIFSEQSLTVKSHSLLKGSA